MKVLLVDDEALARMRLRSLLQEVADPAIAAVGEAATADEALALIRTAPPDAPWDLLLLDIRMPGLVRHPRHAGLHLADALRALQRPPAVVFVSAHAEYALEAFELEAVDYLTKPVRRERLHAALQRVAQRLQQRQLQAASVPPQALDETPVLVFNERGRVLRLPVAEVLYFKAEQKYVTLRTAHHSYLLDEPLTELEARLAQLGGPAFLRVHRNALVARHAIRALELREQPHGPGEEASETWAVRVAPLDEWLAVSRRQVAAVRAALAG
jgi:two-component system response regulator AlgR